VQFDCGHIKIGSSDLDAPDPKHITIEDSNSDASLGDLPILEPPKKVHRGYECNQESDFLPGLTSSPVKQFKCEPIDVDLMCFEFGASESELSIFIYF
jgi:hypothetical protein